MSKKVAIFAFNGEMMCFAHALLNALDLYQKGYDTMLIIEGAATKLLADFEKGDSPFTGKFHECIEHGLIAGVCAACSSTMGTMEAAKRLKLTLLGDMLGHPSIEEYIDSGYEIITI